MHALGPREDTIAADKSRARAGVGRRRRMQSRQDTSCLEAEARCFSARLGDLGRKGLRLIDLIYRACACRPPHNSPAWRNTTVPFLAAWPLAKEVQDNSLVCMSVSWVFPLPICIYYYIMSTDAITYEGCESCVTSRRLWSACGGWPLSCSATAISWSCALHTK